MNYVKRISFGAIRTISLGKHHFASAVVLC